MMEFNAEEAMRIARWFIVSRPRLKRVAMWLGGVDEVVNESMVMLCKNSNGLKMYTLSTCVTRNVRWAIANMTHTKTRQDMSLKSKAIAKTAWVEPEQECFAASRELSELVKKELVSLSDRDYEIVTERMLGKTLQEVADSHKITRARVRQLEHRAWRRLAPSLEYLEGEVQ